jgi:hypothetical protein
MARSDRIRWQDKPNLDDLFAELYGDSLFARSGWTGRTGEEGTQVTIWPAFNLFHKC